jgi:NADP-dependent 3-hydroxy acid dehydrogenase YdfG
MVISRRLMLFTRKSESTYRKSKILIMYSGCEPLTPEDIAEIIVFAAGRRENVVVADTLVFPSHQVRYPYNIILVDVGTDDFYRPAPA